MKRIKETVKYENPILQTLETKKKQKTGFYSSMFAASHSFNLIDWGNLPIHVVLQIFQYLPLVDRARASSVCRRWNEVFHIPDLWRKFEFELNQPATSYLKSTHPDLIQQIIKRHANHLQYVSFKVYFNNSEFCCIFLHLGFSLSLGGGFVGKLILYVTLKYLKKMLFRSVKEDLGIPAQSFPYTLFPPALM